MWAAGLLLQVAVVEAAIFQPNGKIHLTSGNLLVTANINTRPFTRRCQETSKAVASIPTRPNSPEQHIKTHIGRVINDTCDQIKGWPSWRTEEERRGSSWPQPAQFLAAWRWSCGIVGQGHRREN
jgi:hypothetical protein